MATLPYPDFEISRMIFGCWAIVGGFNWARMMRAIPWKPSARRIITASAALIQRRPANGQSENLLAKNLSGKR